MKSEPLLLFLLHLDDGRTLRTLDEEEAARIINEKQCDFDVRVVTPEERQDLDRLLTGGCAHNAA